MVLSSITIIAIVCSILGACLFVTSAVLIYKLRPGRVIHHGKISDISSDTKIPPVRKLAILQGRVISIPSTQRKIPKMPRWPHSLYSSHQPSVAASSTNAHSRVDVRDSRHLLAERDLEAQALPFVTEKDGQHSVLERPIPSRAPRRLEKRRKSISRKSKALLNIPESLPTSSWRSYNEHRSVGDVLTSPVGRLTPPLEGPKEGRDTGVVVEQVSSSASPPVISPFKKSTSEDPSNVPKRSYSGSQDKAVPLMNAKSSDNSAISPNTTKLLVGRSVLKAASISAIPTSAFEPKPTPPSSDTGDSSTGTSGSRINMTRVSYIRKPSPLNLRESTPLSLDFGFPSPPLTAQGQLEATVGESFDQATTIVQHESSNEFQTRPSSRRRSRSRSRSHSCSRSRSTSRSVSRSRSHPHPHRTRKRPPPITVNLPPVQTLPLVVRTPASPPSNNLDTLLYNPITLIYSPEPVSPINEEADAAAMVPTPLRIPSPPLPTSKAPTTTPSSAKFRGAANRRSTQTVDSSTYSPTFSVAPVRRVPLYAGRAQPRINRLGMNEDENTRSTGKRRRVSSKTLELASIPMMPSSVIHAGQATRISVDLAAATPANTSVEGPVKEQSNSPAPVSLETSTQSPRRRVSIQALDYDQILNPFQVRRDKPAPASETKSKPQVRKISTVQPLSQLHNSAQSPNTLQSPTAIKSSLANTGRRKSRYSHLYDKALPALPSKPIIPKQSDEHPRDDRRTASRKLGINTQLPYPRDSLVRQESLRVSPIKASQSGDLRGGAKTDEDASVSPLTEDFPADLRRSDTKGRKEGRESGASPPLSQSAIYW